MKRFAGLLVLLTAVAYGVIFFVFRTEEQPPDTLSINEAVRIVLPEDAAVYETVTLLSGHLTQAFRDMDEARRSRDRMLRATLYIFTGVFMLAGLGLCLYLERAFFVPFRRMKGFARRIAAGDLDIPLAMDGKNLFGAFTESFDIMRDRLRTARENEYAANQSKKELVASLSHDIKTPVASIMSAMDIMRVKAKDERERHTAEVITAKLEQIDALVTNMFHAALEELRALKVSPREVQSMEIAALCKNSDYEGRIGSLVVPDCIVLADPLRLQQVFDNIIRNSYKHADTGITVESRINGQALAIDIIDYGEGVPEEELPLLVNKYYRGKNAGQTEGYGLGLYLSKYFMEQMGGGLTCANRAGGFSVTLELRLA
ncbi:MAG: HAMP domain-containing histidine kinase [Defluviitaleaceae bacterium]|nr:HAMP domain-containing histidine kinase [Defluviitaleaceae bacterium]